MILTLLCCYALGVAAQTPFAGGDSIDANNINALTLLHGDMWWDPSTEQPRCNYPNGSRTNISFASAIWMSGYDDGGKLHVAAQTYRQDGNDYWPGPLDASGSLDYATSKKWAKVWKVRRSDVNYYNSVTGHTVANTPPSILYWPGSGNTYACGKDGAHLDVTGDMAPFVDRDGDGRYEPLKGDYPAFQGEQALWWVFSDNGPTHSQTKGAPLKVELHGLAYAFKRNTLIDDVVYYDYTVVNKSAENYHDLRLALWSDAELGYYMDDFIGFDSSRRMGIVYNATMNDGITAGNPPNSYGTHPPIVGTTFVRLPGDAGTGYQPAGSYMYYNNDLSIIGIPTVDTQYDHYMRSRMANGAHLQYMGVDRNYIMSDDISLSGGWNECSSGNNPGDRRFIQATNSFELPAGARQRVVIAMVVDSIGGGCPSVTFDRIKIVADTAWGAYHAIAAGVSGPSVGDGLKIYPNPAHDVLTVDCNMLHGPTEVVVCDMIGRTVLTAQCKPFAKTTLDIGSLENGVYLLRYNGENGNEQYRFIKR